MKIRYRIRFKNRINYGTDLTPDLFLWDSSVFVPNRFLIINYIGNFIVDVVTKSNA